MFKTQPLSQLSSETKKIKITGYVNPGKQELKVRFTDSPPSNLFSAIDISKSLAA